MNNDALFWPILTHRLGWALVHSLWHGAAVAGLLWVVLSLLRRGSPQLRYLASAIALMLMPICMGITYCVVASPSEAAPQVTPVVDAKEPTAAIANAGIHPQPFEPATTATPTPIDMPRTPQSVPSMVAAAASESSTSFLPPQPSLPPPQSSHPSFAQRMGTALPWVVIAWAVGVTLLSLWNLCGWVAAQRLRILGTNQVGPEVAATVERLARRLQLTKPVRVLRSLLAETPVVIGWLRPVVLLPTSVLTGLTPAQLEAVLAHELDHIRRHDYLVNLFQVAVETLLFYHPAIWWISRQIRLEREQCCDDVAVSVCGDRRVYAESLAALEEVRLAGFPALAAGGAGGAQLLVRIRRLLGLADSSTRRSARACTAILLFLVAGIMAAGLYSKSPSAKAVSQKDNKAQEQKKANNPWTTTLQSGVEVELVGVCGNPSAGLQWWRPDGSPLGSRPYTRLGGSVTANKDQLAREFAVRLSGPSAPIVGNGAITWQFDPAVASLGGGSWPVEPCVRLDGAGALIPKSSREVTVRVGVAAGPWVMQVETADNAGNESMSLPDGIALFSPVTERNGDAIVTLTHNLTGVEVRVVAVTPKGSEHAADVLSTTSAANVVQLTSTFRGLPADHIKQFRLQTRPYEWAEFKHVMLRPRAPGEAASDLREQPATQAINASMTRDLLDPKTATLAERTFIDFSNGQTASTPREILAQAEKQHDGELVWDWARRQKLDAQAQLLRESGAITGVEFYGVDLTARQVPNAIWDAINPSHISAELDKWSEDELRHSSMKAESFPTSFVFKTREGNLGVLQILNFDDNSSEVNIRFKLFSGVAPTTTTRPANE